MKKTTKTEAAKAAKPTTPAKPAPSPAKKPKTAAARKPAAVAPAPAVRDDSGLITPVVVSSVTALPVPTTIVAQIDVGFGNTLYIRGDGPGLSWEKGTTMDCVADDKWSISLSETAKPVVFKLLINDLTWCTGDDYIAQPGSTVAVTPVF